MKEFRLYRSRWKLVRLIALCSIFVVVGYFMLGRADAPQWVAWLCIGFFGLGLPLGIYQLLDRRPQIVVNELGIFDRNMHHEFINWEIIQDVYLVTVHRQPIICLVVDEAFEPSRGKSKFKQGVASLNKGLGFQELNLSLGLVSIDAMRFAEFILAMRGAQLPEREVLVHNAIANL